MTQTGKKRAFIVMGMVMMIYTLSGMSSGLVAPQAPFPVTNLENMPLNSPLISKGVLPQMPKANTNEIIRKWQDIAYSTGSEAQKLDIYLPNTGKGPFPVIVSIHGGAFKFGDKGDGMVNPMLEGLAHGYAVVSINYRLSGEAKFPSQIQDVKAALRWLKAHAQEYSLQSDKIALWGGSAGGYLAALAGTSSSVKEFEDVNQGNMEHSSNVQAVVDWFGPIDFSRMDDQFKQKGIQGEIHSSPNSNESQLFGQSISEIPDEVKKADPQTYISKDCPPFFIQHGTADKVIPTEQSVSFAAALKAVIGDDKVVFEKIEGAGHGDPAFETPKNLEKVFAFLDKYLK